MPEEHVDGETVPEAFIVLTEIAEAKGDVPDDGSGLSGIYHLEFPSEYEHDWLVWLNTEREELEADGPGDQTHRVPAFRATVWYGTHLIGPVMLLGPHSGQMLNAGDEFNGFSVEDQFIQDARAELEVIEGEQ